MTDHETTLARDYNPTDKYFTGITGALVSIAADWSALNEIPISGGAVGGGGSGETRLPGGTQRINLIADGTRLLMQWCLVVLDERELPGTSLDPTNVLATCRWLREHARWLAGHETGYDANEELRDYAGQVRSLVAPTGVRSIPIGACPRDECPGVVKARMTGDAKMDADQDLVCDVDRDHAWGSGQYRTLARLLGRDEPLEMSIGDLAPYLTMRFRRLITEGQIRNWQRRNADDLPLVSLPLAEFHLDPIVVVDWYTARITKKAQAA